MEVVLGLVIQQHSVLLLQRPHHPKTYGLWSFPGGKIEAQESSDQALIREMHEEIGIKVTQAKYLMRIHHQGSCFHAYWIQQAQGPFSNPEQHVWDWAELRCLEEYPTFQINFHMIQYLKNIPLMSSEIF